MASIKGRDTKPEIALRRALWAKGIRGYRCHLRAIPGSPDVAFTRWRVAVFVDGVWWHGHPDHFRPGARGPYWDRKIAGNIARDARVDEQLKELSWRVVRLWDVDVLGDPGGAASQVDRVMNEQRRLGGTG